METTPVNPEAAAAGMGIGFILVWLVLCLFYIIVGWRVFAKAGQPGWGSIIPIYNIILALKIAGKPVWWIILCLIPGVNIVPAILVPIGIAKNFGKGGGFAAGLILLGFIFYPVLAFGSAEYIGAGDGDANPPPVA